MSSSSLLTELGALSDRFVNWYDHIWAVWPAGTQIQQTIIKNLPKPAELYPAIAGAQGEAIGRTVLGVTISSLTFFSQFIAVLVLSIYWSIDQLHFERLWLSLLPAEQRSRAREIWRDIEMRVGAYIRSELGQSILAGIMLGIGLSIMGVQYPIMLALFGAIAWFIPWLGGVIALLPIAWVGFMTSPLTAGIAVFYAVVVFLFLELVVEPRLYSRRQYNSLLSILLIIALADSFGLVGILIAPPLAAAIQIFYNHMIAASIPAAPQNTSSKEIADLEARLRSVRELAQQQPPEDNPQANNLVERLDGLIRKADQVLNEE
jgi:predicted PurR-regulated permease PerM